jgi:integral membrane protein (TIGR01906 family)
MKGLGVAVRWMFMLCLPLLLLTASISWEVNSHWLYNYGFHKYSVGQTLANSGLELTDSEMEEIYAGLISYFNSDEEYISLTVMKDGKPFELFTSEEVIHFKDVKGLIWLDYWVLLGMLTYVLAYAGVSFFWLRDQRQLARGVVGGGGITLALMSALGLGVVLDFAQLFLQFHLISFTNRFWSAEGYMLLLFPFDFFYDAALLCAVITAGLAVILSGVAGSSGLFTRDRATSGLRN